MGNKGCFESGCLNRPQNYRYNNQRQNYINQHRNQLHNQPINQNNEVKVIKRKPKQANFDFFQAYSINHDGKNDILEGILEENKNINNEQSFSKIIKEKTAESSPKNKQNERVVSNNNVEFVRTQSVMEYPPNTGNNEKRRSNAFSITLVGNEDLSGVMLPSKTIKKVQKQKPNINGIQMPPRCMSYNPNVVKVQTGLAKENKFVKTQH